MIVDFVVSCGTEICRSLDAEFSETEIKTMKFLIAKHGIECCEDIQFIAESDILEWFQQIEVKSVLRNKIAVHSKKRGK